VPLAAPDLLVAVLTPLLADPSALRRLCESAIPALGNGSLCPSGFAIAREAQSVEPFEGAVRTPPPEPPLDGLPRRKVSGQEPPGAATLQDVEEDRVEDLAGGVALRTSSPAGRRDVRLDAPPFGIREISRIAPFHAEERTSQTYPSRFSKQFLHALR
jgi:hypothetical protein